MKKRFLIRLLLATLAGCALASGAHAQSSKPSQLDREIMSSDAFLSSHPDLRYRLLGLRAFKAGDQAQAMTLFLRAARFADKPSQAMVAEMYWNGWGVTMDRPLAYAWMDLAAERHYKVMLVNRERYWEALSETERTQAIAVGQPIFAEYADKSSKPRLERILRNARRGTTGSRTGFTGNLSITIPGPYGDLRLDGSQFYQEKFWKPEAYWAWQSEDWKELPKGQVNVGPLQVPAKPAAKP